MKSHHALSEIPMMLGFYVSVYFMFGYPTETEEDFQMTLDFVRNNHTWIDMVDPSKTYTSILPNTYLYNNAEEFGVKPYKNYLFSTFWETKDGKNTYPERLKRYERLCSLARELGYRENEFMEERRDKWMMLGHYYLYKNQIGKARECYEKDMQKHGHSQDSAHFLSACSGRSKKQLNGLNILSSYYGA